MAGNIPPRHQDIIITQYANNPITQSIDKFLKSKIHLLICLLVVFVYSKQLMGQIIDAKQIPAVVDQLKKRNEKIVLVGGCFDILHSAHIEFLRKAKAEGDALIVLLESDARIKKLKGENRPINKIAERASILANLPMVSSIITLKDDMSNIDYEILVKMIKPDIIAITSGNPVYEWERIYAKETGSKIVEVMKRKTDYSTTKIAQKIKL